MSVRDWIYGLDEQEILTEKSINGAWQFLYMRPRVMEVAAPEYQIFEMDSLLDYREGWAAQKE